jgi:hypothetical protein
LTEGIVFHFEHDPSDENRQIEQLKRLHQQYTAGVSSDDALQYALRCNEQSHRVLLNSLGERTGSPAIAEKKTTLYTDLLRAISDRHLDASISVKLSDLGLRQSISIAKRNLEKLLDTAQQTNHIIEIDMEYRSLVQPTIECATQMLRQGFQFRLAIQSGLLTALPLARRLLRTARRSPGNIGFRIVTGSCYAQNQQGYNTTLETTEAQTIAQFYMLLELAWRWRREKGLCSAVGTQNLDRIVNASRYDCEIQLLKGEEHTKAYFLANELKNKGKARLAVYVGFGSLDDEGVQAYLLRRIK